MRRSLPLLALFLALLIIAAYLYLSDRRGSYRDTDILFAVRDTSVVDRIIISGGQDSIILERVQGHWRVNGLQYARERLVENLLLAIYRLQADVPVPKKEFDRLYEELTHGARKAEVFHGEDLLRAYSMYYDNSTGASYMMLEGSSAPFRVYLPGFSAEDISSIYRLEENYWRDKLLISLGADRIAGLRIDYRDRPGASFRLARQPDGEWSLFSISDKREVDEYSVEALNNYLSYFSHLRYDEAFDPGVLKGESPGAEAEILITDTGGNETRLRIFPRYKQNGEMDLDRLYLQLDGVDEIMLARYVQVDLILKDISYFTGTDR